MKLRHSVSLALAALALSGSGVLFAQTTSDGSESDTAGEFALPILASGDSFTDSFEGDVGTRLYGFQGSAGDEVTITMTQITDELDPFLVLIGPNGEMVASDDDSGTEASLSAAITDAELPEDGSYFIIASSYINIDSILDEPLMSEQEYTLTLDGNTTPDSEGYDPDLLTITVSELTDDVTVEGESSEALPVTYYIFTAEEGANLDLVIDRADFNTIIHLFDADGNRIAVNNDDEERGGFESGLYDFEAPYTGSYLLIVTDVFFYSAGDSEAILTFTGGEFSLSADLG